MFLRTLAIASLPLATAFSPLDERLTEFSPDNFDSPDSSEAHNSDSQNKFDTPDNFDEDASGSEALDDASSGVREMQGCGARVMLRSAGNPTLDDWNKKAHWLNRQLPKNCDSVTINQGLKVVADGTSVSSRWIRPFSGDLALETGAILQLTGTKSVNVLKGIRRLILRKGSQLASTAVAKGKFVLPQIEITGSTKIKAQNTEEWRLEGGIRGTNNGGNRMTLVGGELGSFFLTQPAVKVQRVIVKQAGASVTGTCVATIATADGALGNTFISQGILIATTGKPVSGKGRVVMNKKCKKEIRIVVPEGVLLQLRSLNVNGKEQAQGTYKGCTPPTSDSCVPWITGTGSINVSR